MQSKCQIPSKKFESKQVTRIPLGMTAGYAGHWKSWEGIREFVQNWHDGLLEVGRTSPSFQKKVSCGDHSTIYEASIDESFVGLAQYDELDHKLILINKNVSLHRKVLLLGYSEKVVHRDVVGHFGEGMKVGALSLLRQGMSVLMATSSDVWRFELEIDPAFEEQVLTVKVSPLNASQEMASPSDIDVLALNLEQNDTVTIITGLTSSEWECFSRKILFLEPAMDFITTTQGSLLLDDHYQGHMFVKGIWISRMENMAVGVNLYALDLDRDRIASLKESEMEHQLSSMWIQAIRKRPDLIPRFFELLQNREGCIDARHASFYSSSEDSDLLAAHFVGIHGEGSIPVGLAAAGNEQITRLRNELNKNIVICSNVLCDILGKSSLPTVDMLLQSLPPPCTGDAFPEYIPLQSLTTPQLDNLLHALELLRVAFPNHSVSLENIDVLNDPSSMTPHVSFQNESKRIVLSSSLFDSEILHSRNELCLSPEKCRCPQVTICTELMRAVQQSSQESRFGTHRILNKLVDANCLEEPKFCKSIHHCLPGCKVLDFQHREETLMRDLHLLNVETQKSKSEYLLKLNQMQKEISKLEKSLLKEEVLRMNVTNQVRREVEREKGLQIEQLQSDIEDFRRDSEMYQTQTKNLEERIIDMSASGNRKTEVLHLQITKFHQLLVETNSFLQEANNLSRDEILSKKDTLVNSIRGALVEAKGETKVSCIVCMEHEVNTVLLPCRHNVLCEACANLLSSCPVCRNGIDQKIKVFG